MKEDHISNPTWQHQDSVGDVQVVRGHQPAGARPDHQTLSRERRDEQEQPVVDVLWHQGFFCFLVRSLFLTPVGRNSIGKLSA